MAQGGHFAGDNDTAFLASLAVVVVIFRIFSHLLNTAVSIVVFIQTVLIADFDP